MNQLSLPFPPEPRLPTSPSGHTRPEVVTRGTSRSPGGPRLLSADFSPVCGDQMGLYNELHSEFHRLGAEVIGDLGRRRLVPCRLPGRAPSPLHAPE
jgi:hypothetical protein